jgi:cobalt-precorrin 5A hydrolase
MRSSLSVRAGSPCAPSPAYQIKIRRSAVIVLDEGGSFAIPLLSGHIGGANMLAKEIAGLLGALPIITTATDSGGLFAIASWAARTGLRIINPGRIKRVSALLLAGETVAFRSLFPVIGPLPEGFVENTKKSDVAVTIKTRGRPEMLRLVPPVLTLGVGCRKDVAAPELERAFDMILRKAGFYREAVAQVCSIDLKADEAGLLEFCRTNGLPFKTFSAAALNALKGRFTASEFVRQTTGVDNVCERSAVCGSGGRLLTRKDAGNGITMAFAAAPYMVRFTEE